MKSVIVTDKAPAAIGPYSQAVETDTLIFISGQLPVDPKTGQMAPPEVPAQTEAVLKNILGIMAAKGLPLDNIIKTTVYMTDLGQFQAMNEVYAKYFSKHPPARATVEVKALPKGALVEIEAIAEKQI
ncbi:MAG TPA: reactive intermediate/imine deaminase [Elusimicrobia bacterium]|jgi:2-iminobutanoate/2-iminopropanoate deaminase|nr:reactive intermediate/imine deaminase [Elusimicrobiota bacterium]